MGFTIALIVHSLDPSLSSQLILFGHLIAPTYQALENTQFLAA